MTMFLHKELSYTVRGVLFDVFNQLGSMLPERFYQTAVSVGLENKNICCQTEKEFTVEYHGVQVGRYYTDVWIEGGKILLELKVAPAILPLHKAQAISYLKVTDADVAYVVNFGEASLVDERLPNYVREKTAVFQWEENAQPIQSPDPVLMNEILQAVHQVHFELGSGFLHQVYRRATMVQLREQNIGFKYIKEIPIYYQNTHLGNQETRLICVEQKVVLAIFAVKAIDEAMKNQLRMRMRYLDIGFGLLANFYNSKLEIVVVNSR